MTASRTSTQRFERAPVVGGGDLACLHAELRTDGSLKVFDRSGTGGAATNGAATRSRRSVLRWTRPRRRATTSRWCRTSNPSALRRSSRRRCRLASASIRRPFPTPGSARTSCNESIASEAREMDSMMASPAGWPTVSWRWRKPKKARSPKKIEDDPAKPMAEAESIQRANQSSAAVPAERQGYSPMQFAKSERLRRARQMLLEGNPRTSVSQIAFKCGFANLGHFANDFRKMYGELPSEVFARGRRSK